MKRDGERRAGYVQKVHEQTWRFAQELLAENEKLRALAASLRSEKLRLEEELLAARQAMAHREQERTRLERQLAEIEADGHRLYDRYAELEQQNWNLLNLYVASHRLHGTLDRQEVLATVQEIITNLVGSEEMGVFELDRQQATLRLLASVGTAAERLRSIPLGSGTIGRVALTGEPYLAAEAGGAGGSAGESDLTACIPLKVDGRVTGTIAVFRLLEQKAGLEAVDRELLDLLGSHAGMALYCTALHAGARAVSAS